MPDVKVRMPTWMSRDIDAGSGGMDEICLSGPDLESIIAELRSQALGNEVLLRILHEKTFGIILNGRYVNPYDRSESTLRDGDEILFVPLLDGG